MTIEETLRVVESLLHYQRLNKVQELVFRQAWEGYSYKEIAESSGYQQVYIKDTGSKLWQQLSKQLGEKVTKNNLQGILKRYQQQQQQTASVPEPIEFGQETDSPRPYQNLPSRNYAALIGRQIESDQLLEWLSFDCPIHCISVQGIGGAGKTTLVLETAYRCLQASQGNGTIAPTFDAIIFTSAKPHHLTNYGILPRLKPDTSLLDIFRAIAYTLRCPNLPVTGLEEAYRCIQERLGRQRTLLIVDNLETLEEQNHVLSFLYDLPSTVKAVITSRKGTPFSTINLNSLPRIHGIHLIRHHAKEKGVVLSDEECQKLYQKTDGIPAAIVYAIGQLAAGYLFKQVLPQLTLPTSDFCRFYFQGSITLIKEQPSHQLLMALAIFPKPATGEAVANVAGVTDPNAIAHGLAQLQQLSLVRQQAGRYEMLPITRDYALAELQHYPNFQQAARNRWVNWYLKFAQENGGKDWTEWHGYQAFKAEWENLTDVLEWCIAQDRYPDVRDFWQTVKCYTYTQGRNSDRLTYWNTPLQWTDWLIQAAQRYQDWATALEVILDQGKKLLLRGQPKHLEDADTLFTHAWSLRHHQSLDFQLDLAIQIALLHIHRQQFPQATDWLKQAKKLLEKADKPESDARRSFIHILYYQGEIHYKTQNYHQASVLFQQVLEQAQMLGWQRAIYLAKDWLADIAIEQGNLDDAQPILTEGLRVAEHNQDQCRMAYAKRSLARLEEARGNWNAALRWATAAKENFLNLGMIPEVEETQALLQTISHEQLERISQ